MARDWYLMQTAHDSVSGFGTDDFNALAADSFKEATDSFIASTVEVCNYDLTERKTVRVIVEGRLQDTRLNALQRRVLAPIGTIHAGEYVYYENMYWLVIGLVDNNKVYEKGVMIICNYLLTWRNAKGEIIQRWGSASSASQYNNGETSNDRYLQLRSDQIIILTPDDAESISIPHGKRFIIDNRCRVYEKEFQEGTMKDTTNPLITYEMTRIDNVIFGYQKTGHSEFMVTQDEKHLGDGYYVVDGNGYWLCEEDAPKDSDDKMADLSCRIDCNEPVIYNGIEPTVFTSVFLDANGDPVDITPIWEINSPIRDDLIIEYGKKTISIATNNKKLIGKSFELILTGEGWFEPSFIYVHIKAFI